MSLKEKPAGPNYIQLINRFWQLDIEANFSHLEVHLYFKLLEINNRLSWRESFRFPNSRLEGEVNTRQKNLIEARQKLIDAGLLLYEKGTTREAGTYRMLFERVTKESNQESNQGCNQKVIRGALNKQEVKENISETFEKFRIEYPGVKKGLKTELDNFLNKNKPETVELLIPALNKEVEFKKRQLALEGWAPNWKNLKTWINQRCWEQEFPQIQEVKRAPLPQHNRQLIKVNDYTENWSKK